MSSAASKGHSRPAWSAIPKAINIDLVFGYSSSYHAMAIGYHAMAIGCEASGTGPDIQRALPMSWRRAGVAAVARWRQASRSSTS